MNYIPHEINCIVPIIKGFLYPDLTSNDLYADKFSYNDKNYRIKNAWFYDDFGDILYCDSKFENKVFTDKVRISVKELKLKYSKNMLYEILTTRYKEDMLFGFQSHYKNKQGQIIEFIVKNINGIQLGPKSKNGILSFLSNIDNGVWIKVNCETRSNVVHNFINHANQMAYDSLFFEFDEEINPDGKMMYICDTCFIPNNIRCNRTTNIVLENFNYTLQALEIIKVD